MSADSHQEIIKSHFGSFFLTVVNKDIVVSYFSLLYSKAMNKISNSVVSNIRDGVASIAPFDILEQEHVADVLSWIDSGVNIFRVEKPDKPPKHLVSYFVLIDPDKRSLLLVDHIKAQLWLPSGGHVEVSEDPRNTVVRELREELNKDTVFLRNNDNPFFITVNETGGLTPGHTDVSLWYLVRGDAREFLSYDKSEFNDVEWFTFDEILEMDPVIFDRHMIRFTRKL